MSDVYEYDVKRKACNSIIIFKNNCDVYNVCMIVTGPGVYV